MYSSSSSSSSGRVILKLILLLVALETIHAWVPPLAPLSGNVTTSTWETAEEMRTRLNIQFNYTPTFINAEMCRGLNEDDCRHADESMLAHVERTQRHLQQRKQKRIMNPRQGKVKVMILLVMFVDHVGRKVPTRDAIQDMWDTTIVDWFDANAHGNYDIEPVVMDWVVSDYTEEWCASKFQGVTPRFQRCAWASLKALDDNHRFDFYPFDANEDEQLDSVGTCALYSTNACY